ncbi:MAG: gliding motility-associated C-terminal domain-containing protein [Saprospiraceae bacterium]|uniref:Gliding motility-associated C-terminal domain-containing protein n=1 Tax=Candidatus Defluviibacterium haderslevense TaxID=2981993 RepID=A0A9D7XF74_9BACT|nr:gliding motility-associated C-terminal domain-containing protein [Candidatus Defluviibacterium haderslevense]
MNTIAQNCFDAGFESGTTQGYTTYIGNIDEQGNVVITTEFISPDRHRVMHKNEGFDPIAMTYCQVNKNLPIVPPGGGQYSMRLGNSNVGAEAERIVLSFTVTPNNSFFLLRYALLLDDPDHKPFEQPRFEMRIKDQNGNTFPCGEYFVKAARNIPGFENCGQWRVRPWTTAGFELQSYIGQVINIEILTTDCSLGGHAGYAYLDATCKPLEIKIDGYCKDSTTAKLIVTQGFDRYLWNTGDTTSTIVVQNPKPGTIYSVTVTSSTGCSLTLKDTIPEFEELAIPKFNKMNDTLVCPGTKLWVHPTGIHLNDIYWVEGGYSADSFLIHAKDSITLHFVSSDNFGCNRDILVFNLFVPSDAIMVSPDQVICPGDSVTLSIGVPDALTNLNWTPGNLKSKSIKVSPNVSTQYHVIVNTGKNCDVEKLVNVTVKLAPPVQLNMNLDTTICEGQSININVQGEGIGTIFWPGLNRIGPSLTIQPKVSKSYPIEIVNLSECDTFLYNYNALVHKIPYVNFGSDFCGSQDQLLIVPNIESWNYTWNNFTTDTFLEVRKSGLYTIVISNECGVASDSIFIEYPYEKQLVFFPNIFSPSSSNAVNQYFKPFFYSEFEYFEDYLFEIYDRWGNRVYRSKSPYDKGWDGIGYSNGTYVWRLVFYSKWCKIKRQFQGDVYLY